MIKNLLFASILIVLTSMVHIGATRLSLYIIDRAESNSSKKKKIWKLIWLDSIVILMIISSILESMIWAASLVWIGAMQHFEEAVYFSIVTFTTLGYGDITLHADWRIFASLQAATGIIIFGWSTAIVMVALQSFYFKRRIKNS